MVIRDVRGGKFYGLLPEKENTVMAIVFMILVISTLLTLVDAKIIIVIIIVYCCLFSLKPKDHKMIKPGAFQAEEKELVFDIDMTDYDEVRTCCKLV